MFWLRIETHQIHDQATLTSEPLQKLGSPFWQQESLAETRRGLFLSDNPHQLRGLL